MTRVTKGGTEFDPAAIDRTEARFWRELWDAIPPALAAEHGLRRGNFGPIQATVAATLPEVRPLNLMLDAASGEAAAEGFLDEAIAWVRGEGGRGFALLSGEPLATGAAEAALTAADYERASGWMRFVRDPHPPRFKVSGDVEVIEVDGSDDAPFGAIAALGFDLPAWAAGVFAPLPLLPDWRCYVARLDGEPQACGAMLVDGDVAVFGLGATLESGRRRGCQQALLGRRIEDAAAAGARTLFVETGERVPGHPSTSYGNILRAGFEEAYLCPGWIDARLPSS